VNTFPGNVYRIMTSHTDQNPVASFSLKSTAVQFRVRACSDATIDLLGDHSNQTSVAYRIVMASNQNNESRLYRIRNGQSELLQHMLTPGLLQCDALVSFWIETNQTGKIAVGQGSTFGQSVFLNFVDPESMSSRGLSFSSSYGDADWEIPVAHGNYCGCLLVLAYQFHLETSQLSSGMFRPLNASLIHAKIKTLLKISAYPAI
jgi:Farnesoic acid 0-methyl transferase